MLWIRLLGGFFLEHDNSTVTKVNTARLQALLAYLVLHRDAPQSRLHMAAQFWPDSTEAQARTNLRHQLHVLRQALPLANDYLQADAHTIQWRHDAPCHLDVENFERTVNNNPSTKALQAALDAYGGDLLPSCYDEWIIQKRDHLRQTFVEASERLIEQFDRQRDYVAALHYAQRLQRHDPLHESAYRHLMRLHALTGALAAAKRTYQTCVTILQCELGAEPSPATQYVYARLANANANATPRHNLPARLTSFVGRVDELRRIDELLRDPACRLLTLVGVGGVGKTRLAVEAARDQLDAYRHGVMLIVLTATSTPEFLVSAIADGLGFVLNSGQEPKQQLLNYLREKDMLVILDNFEHLQAGAGLLVDMLKIAPAVKIVVTSRERLRLTGEWVFELVGLAVPEAAETAHLENYSAAQLFLHSARRLRAELELTADQRLAVARLCRLVEGLPLALELAATWVHVLSCGEIVEELTRSLDVLATSSPHIPERHHSIRAVFDHSRSFLSDEEQRAFRRLSIFRGGFRREAAEHVAGASLPLLAALMDKSLLRRRSDGRCEMHELIRQYAAEQLAAVPEEHKATQDRHARYYLEFLHEQEPRLKTSLQQQALADIKCEIDNVRLACQWAIKQAWAPAIGRAAQDLYLFFDAVGWCQEAEGLFTQTADMLTRQLNDMQLDENRQELSMALGQVLARLGWALLRLGQPVKAKASLQEGIAFLRDTNGKLVLADALQNYSMAHYLEGNYKEALVLLDEGRLIAHEQQNDWTTALILASAGLVKQSLGDYDEARALIMQGMTIFRHLGDARLTAIAFGYLSLVTYLLGEHIDAKRWAHESLRLSFEMNDRINVIHCLNRLGAMACASGGRELPEAERFYVEGLAAAKEMGDQWHIAISLSGLGYVNCAMTDYPAARHYFLTALRTTVGAQQVPRTLEALAGLATVACHQPVTSTVSDRVHRQGWAVEVFSLVLNHPAADYETKEQAQHFLSEIEAELPADILVASQERGRARNFETLVAEIFAETSD